MLLDETFDFFIVNFSFFKIDRNGSDTNKYNDGERQKTVHSVIERTNQGPQGQDL